MANKFPGIFNLKPLILAPMDGISDQPFRYICKKNGASILFSEFINVTNFPHSNRDLDKRVIFSNFERPFGFQLYGICPKNFLLAAQYLENFQPEFFDINLGCSIRRIFQRGAGSALLSNPKQIEEIIRLLRLHINIPITAKIRCGMHQDDQSYLHIAKLLENYGVSFLTVHARSVDQSWNEKADWKKIAEVKKAVSIPVIGNGDVKNIQDIEAIYHATDCDGVMIGRSALGNPWIFNKIEKSTIPASELLKTIYAHWQHVLAFVGPEKANRVFRKHLKAYVQDSVLDENFSLINTLSSANPMLKFIECFPLQATW